MAKKSKKFRLTKKLALLSSLAVILIVVGGTVYWHYHTRPHEIIISVPPDKNTTPATNSTNSQVSTNSSSDNADDKQAPSSGGFTSSGSSASSSSPSNGTGQPPLTPTGPFVSNHGSSSHPATTENSVCNTTPGASCYIEFTMGNTTIKLQAGTADSNGSVYWNGWNVNDQGFTSGSWTITAVATLNGQTATSPADQTPLIVQ
jgi:hypothetical protein